MKFFDEKTAVDLEFDQIREWLANFCIGPTAAGRLSKLQPLESTKEVEYRLQLIHELLLIRNKGLTFPRIEFEELNSELKLLQISNSVLEEKSIIRLLDATRFVNELFTFFKENPEQFIHLKGLLGNAYHTKVIEKEIESIFDKRLKVKDDASVELMRLRQGIGAIKKQINRNFDKALRAARNSGYIDEISENVIDNRRVLTVISTYKRKVDGSILGASKTGSLTYIEPKVNSALNAELDQLLDDERKEVRRILAELTNFMRQHEELISAYQVILCEFDELNAKVRLAKKIGGIMPQINFENQDTFLKDAYHPILQVKNNDSNEKTIPQTFSLTQKNRLLVISGPNAGGKSITLKTIGLLQLMFQSALLVPVHVKSSFAFFDYILSDIGDNQSIENQLSTYSYRLQRMNFFLKKMSPKSLMLLDEFGTGSDPDLGGALAEVFFEKIYDAGCFGVLTTHYSNIKLRAAQLAEAENANMLFNRNTLSPEYQLEVGQPGSSFTFEVAQMNGIPKDMIKQAKLKVDGQKIKFDQLISDLQRDKSVLQKLKREGYEAKLEMEESREAFEEKSEHYEERLKTQEKRIEQNNKYLNHGKKMSQFIQHFPTRSKKKQAEHLEELKKYLVMENAKINLAAKKAKAEAQRKKAVQKNKAASSTKSKKSENTKPVIVGGRVRMKQSRQVGEVIKIEGKEATIVFGNLKAKVKMNQLTAI
ncbi:MAG: DNA mismatch repair protein MutS [Vicingaceae bacterium]